MNDVYDRLFESLSNEHRRRILVRLLNEPSPVYLDSPPDASDDHRRQLIERHHNHLPKLADFGFIRWASTADSIETGSRFEEIRPILELLYESDKQFTAPRR